MGWLSSAWKSVTGTATGAASGLLGGGGGNDTTNSTSTTTSTTVSPVTNVNVDLEPMAEILAQSQEQTARTAQDTAKINLINAELERKQNQSALMQFDGYIEHAKNGLILVGIVGGVLYMKKKKRGKK